MSLNATLDRIKAGLRIVPDGELGPPVKCVRCKDRGVREMTAGSYRLWGDDYGRRGNLIEASSAHPVFLGCECRAARKQVRGELVG